jgi:hypothetical protein
MQLAFLLRKLPIAGLRDRTSRDAQAGTTSTGGGRLKRAKVENPLESAVGGRLCSTAMTAAVWAGAGVWTRCTTMCAVAHSEQFAWPSVPSEWMWAACTAPETTTRSTHRIARRSLHGCSARRGWSAKPISVDYTADSGSRAGPRVFEARDGSRNPDACQSHRLFIHGLYCAG